MILLAIRPFFGPFYCVPLCLVPLLHDRNPFTYSMWSIKLLKHMCRLSFFLLGVSLFFSCYEKRSYLTYQEIFFFQEVLLNSSHYKQYFSGGLVAVRFKENIMCLLLRDLDMDRPTNDPQTSSLKL